MTEAGQHIREEATRWFVRSQEAEFVAEDWRAMHGWLAADPAHADAYAEVEAVWLDLDDAKPGASAEVIALPIARQRKPFRIWLAVGAALAASLAIAVLVGVRSGQAPAPAPAEAPQPLVYASLAGERKAVVLPDGSHVMLNGGSRLEAVFVGSSRRVRMIGGQAIFDVAHDTSRPFLIDLGDRQVRVVGTQFDILRLPAKLVVTVKRGVVAVEPQAGAGEPVRLTAGRQLTHKTGEAGSTVRTVDADQALAWQEGRLSYTGAPLAEVGDDLGRYLGKPVQVDADIAAMPFTGVLNMDEEARVLRRLEVFLPVRAQMSTTGIRLSRAAGR